MRPVAARILDAFQLTRLSLAFGSVCELWLVTLLTRADPRYVHLPIYSMPLWKALLSTAMVAIGLFAFAASLNDLLDLRHDRRFSPERPLAAGRIRTSSAAVLSFGALMLAVVAASTLGEAALVLTVVVAAAIMFYDAVGKHIPSVGIVTVGLVHAASMFIPNYTLGFTLPVWWSMSHSVAIAASVHRFEDKRPYFGPQRILLLTAGWLFWSVVLLGGGALASQGEGITFWPQVARGDQLVASGPVGLVWPVLALAGFLLLARSKVAGLGGAVGSEKLRRYGAMWQAVYAAAWLLAAGLIPETLGMAAMAVAGLVAMTLLKEINGLSGRPLTWR
ncbi:MAG: UbiA family prenyltransferase [Phycisphaerales bacterium]